MCTDVYGGGAHGAVCAMCCEISKAHGCVVCWLAGHIAQSRYCEQCRTDKYGCVRKSTERGAHGVVRAMRSGNSKAHGTHTFCAMSVPVRTSPYQSVLHCPLHVHCAMRSASQWECALEIPERIAHSMPCAIQSILSIMSIFTACPP